jgi:hypothetical protein
VCTGTDGTQRVSKPPDERRYRHQNISLVLL